MKKEIQDKIDLFNKRVSELYNKVCGWLDEEKIEYDKIEKEITLTQGTLISYESKKLEFFTRENEQLFSLTPYGAFVIAAEGRVQLAGSSGEESLVYLKPDTPGFEIVEKIGNGVINTIPFKMNAVKEEGWHWVAEQIIGKKPLFTKEVFLALLERIN